MKIIRPLRIISGTIKNIINDNTKSSEKRLQVCKKCDKLWKGVCTECGCIVKSKSKIFEEYCPMNYWNDIKILKKLGVAIANQNPEKASISVDEENNQFIFNYGKIKQHSDCKLKLNLINDRGNYFSENQDLNNIDLFATCGCTTVKKPCKNLKEGNSCDFEISYDAKVLKNFSKKILLKTDEIAFSIVLKGEVIE